MDDKGSFDGYKANSNFGMTYYPFPFQQRLVISIAHAPAGQWPATGAWFYDWFQFTYLQYPTATEVTSWLPSTPDSSIVRTRWGNLGQDPKTDHGDQSDFSSSIISPGASYEAFNRAGAWTIEEWNLNLSPWSADTFSNVIVKIFWDDSDTPAVNQSLGSFFGGGGDTFGEMSWAKTLKTLFFGFDSQFGNFYSYWPMPFWQRGRIVIENHSSSAIQISTQAAYSANIYIPGSAGYFHAKRTIESPSTSYFSRGFEDYGKGKVIGLMMFSRDYSMDGDEFTYIDDAGTPAIHGDGTEDDHNQGWGGNDYQKALWGGLFNGFDGGYRLYYNDSYIYDRHIEIDYEHSAWSGAPQTGQSTDFLVWYYKKDPGDGFSGNLQLSDQLDVGSSASETSHAYSIAQPTQLVTTSSFYDGMEHNRAGHKPCTDSGRYTNASTQFIVRIDPANDGVLLRRRLNRLGDNRQIAQVFVDGIEVTEARWSYVDVEYQPTLDPSLTSAFADTNFAIPKSYTQGKSEIQIKVVSNSATDSHGMNEYYYWVYSYVPTTVRPPVSSPSFSGTNLGLAATATASSIWGAGYEAGKANDNDPSTRWNSVISSAAGEWLELDFSTATTFNGAEILQEVTWTLITSYRLQYWNGSSWIDAYVGRNMQALERDRFPAVVSQKIRLWVESTSGNTPTIKEFRVFNELREPLARPFTSINLAATATATASSVWGPGFEPAKAKDGDLSTRWNSLIGTSDGEWLQLDFGSTKLFNGVSLDQETTWTWIDDYRIQIQASSGWQDVYAGGRMGPTERLRFPEVSARKVRLLIDHTTGNTPTIKEFGVFSETYTDDFSTATLASSWSWVRQDSTKWSLSQNPGKLRIVTQPGDLFGSQNNAKNLLLRDAPAGDWTATAKLTFAPVADYQQAGLIVYGDDDNYAKLMRAHSGSQVVVGDKEVGGVYTQNLAGEAAGIVYLRVTKAGSNYFLSYNLDGSPDWTPVATYTGLNLGSSLKIGLASFGGTQAIADFDWFDVR
jgi:hypothetical protein